MSKRQLIGGSFAPPLDDAKLSHYESLAADCTDAQCKDYMQQLCKMLRVFWETGESGRTPEKTQLGIAIVPLEDAEIDRIWDFVPWESECDVMGKAFDRLSGETRSAAFHLLWFGRELAQDREPTTNDRVKFD